MFPKCFFCRWFVQFKVNIIFLGGGMLRHTACRILVPLLRIEPRATAVEMPSPSHWTSRELPVTTFFKALLYLLLFQFISVAQSCPTLCDPMNRSTPGLPVHQQLPEFTQTHVHRVSDAIQPSHPLSSPSPAPNPSQHQSLFQ